MIEDKGEIVPSGPRGLTKQGSNLVRRGLDDLAKSADKKGRILLVSDQESSLQVVEKILLANGYEVRSASRQPDAIALAKCFDPQVLVLGVRMPLEVGKELHTSSPSWPYFAPKILLWGEAQESEDLEQRRDHYDFDLLPTLVDQELFCGAMQARMAEAWTNSGNPLHVKNQWLDALRCHEKALALDARCLNAWLNKAWCLDELGRWREAIDSLERAIEINPVDSIPWIRKGDILDRAGQFEQAVLCFDSALAITPEWGWKGRGIALHHLGRYEEALHCFDKVLEIKHPTWTAYGKACEHSDAWNLKGTSLYRMERHQESIECYEKAIEIDPKFAFPWYNKGNTLRTMKKFDGAIRCYDRAIELDPEHAGSWNNKGICLRRLGRFEDALVCHEKALACNPPNILGWYNKALVQEDFERIEDAILSYQQYLMAAHLEVDARFEEALERLRDLKQKTRKPEPGEPRIAYVVREVGTMGIKEGTIGYLEFETAILEALKEDRALHAAGKLSDQAYRGALSRYEDMIKNYIQQHGGKQNE